MISPARLKLTTTVISMSGWTREGGGGLQQVLILAKTSAMVFTCAGCAGAGFAPPTRSAATNSKRGLRGRLVTGHFTSEAT